MLHKWTNGITSFLGRRHNFAKSSCEPQKSKSFSQEAFKVLLVLMTVPCVLQRLKENR